MNNTAIKVSHLTKVYKLYDKPVDRLKESLHPLKKKYHKEFYALNDVSFEIKKGETVGIIGKNGAGKSTLLKIITGVLTPSSGHVHVNGRIASLLELGAGFNPEYTGIENIYLQGTLMGYTKEEMESKIQAILDFADIGDFVHQAVKMYSSGMFARLAFSIAINVEPDILIVDEALSVGDMLFQVKCMAHMRSMMESGVTVLFVSHDTHSIKTLCNKAIWIQNGSMIEYGDAGVVANKYIEMQHLQMNDELPITTSTINLENISCDTLLGDIDIPISVSTNEKEIDTKISQRYGDDRATILDMIVLDKDFKAIEELTSNHEYYIQIAIKFNAKLSTFVMGFSLSSLDGIQQLTWTNAQDGMLFPSVEQNSIVIVTTKIKIPIRPGIYNFSIGVEYPVILNQQHQFLDVIMNYKPIKINFESPEKVFSSMFYTKGDYNLKVIKQ
ncbi:polysaccharide ABC transporter ATP-binding protein [Arcobacter cryaerophilus gv. occultus]|uniref:ABC transporter ATP-binding protein n=1 Tax=Aliarcobacter cryaerophilus TaxID=28198 RepID=UPI000D022343|nr:ABC transporter ATP-binding protein [Aliarcobacter cryaerophilus]PRM91330.1 polysaccharide ABC transporter ATP-binding protein [Arcobacter cryaerophilus gv. occultus]